MALPGPSRYQKQAAVRRRTGDITRLADQYQKNVQAVTGEYEQAFSQYQAQTKEKMAPYEEALGRYTEAMPEYEKQASAYAQRLSDYQSRMQAYDTALQAYSTMAEKFSLPVGQLYGDAPGKMYVASYRSSDERRGANIAARAFGLNPEGAYGYYFDFDPNLYEYEATSSTRGGTTGVLYRRGGPDPGEFTERFTEAAPTAPQAPTAPEVPAFDSSQFEARRGQLETEFKRELGERRSARQRAVSRGGARPLLQGRA
jgi:tetratricopeptide (TPR) repeat protein